MDHPDYTCFNDRVVYHHEGKKSVAFVTNVVDPHTADLVFYCTDSHAWHEATAISFGENDTGIYFDNPEA